MEVLWWSLVIFFARVVDVAMGTIRVQWIVQGRRVQAALMGFFEVLIFILIVSRVIGGGIEHPAYALSYAGGFAAGTLLGVTLSDRMRKAVVEVTVIPHVPWEELEVQIRQAGFALTRQSGMGREGQVEILHIVCVRRELPKLLAVINKLDAAAFVYTQQLTGLRGGQIYGMKSKL
ncbi:MAG: hypothetical protein JXA37_01290 [Chloroflexia bacterium]|nr:hypothetical protein [Chloroflexia bacterium]